MERGKFFAVGVGPGDPELMTVKAIKTIEGCPVVAAADSGGPSNIALKIAEGHTQGKEIVICEMPMIRNKEKLNPFHNSSAERISGILDEGKDVAFITLGDPAVYSSVMYVLERLRKKGYETEIVPGITSFSAAAAALKMPLCERDEPLHIIPASYENTDLDDLYGTKVYMKSGKGLPELRERLRGRNAMMVENATMEDERIYGRLDDTEGMAGYFSLVIVPVEKGGK